jgi:mRNA interferase HigB
MFNVISRKTLLDYCKKYPAAEKALFAWYYEIQKSSYSNLNELKLQHPSASIIGDERVIFNIMGNEYRLITRVIFRFKTVQIKWFGPHNAYNRIDALTINLK